jgi:hypothetical protein
MILLRFNNHKLRERIMRENDMLEKEEIFSKFYVLEEEPISLT